MAVQPDPTSIFKVRVLGHDLDLARQFVAALQRSIDRLSHTDSPRWEIEAATGVEAWAACDFCLLLPWDGGPAQGSDPGLEPLQAHRALRQSLLQCQQSFQALRGQQAQQLHQALAALALRDRALMPAGAQTLGRPGWRLACETCDDPACEHILLGQLQAQRQGVAAQA